MDTEYQTVVDASSLMSTGIPMLIHTFFVLCEVGVATFVGIQGLALLIDPEGGTATQLRWGRPPLEGRSTRPVGAVLLLAGLLILAPVLFGVDLLSSVIGLSLVAGLLLSLQKRSEFGRRVRGVVVGAALLAGGFLFFEGADPAAQTREVVQKALDWRSHELDWQLDHDRRSPKVGELAPDFELSDSEGANPIRLSTFRGERPVALVFGSYT